MLKQCLFFKLENGNSQFGKKWVYDGETRKSIKINKNEPLPEGFYEGRIIKSNKIKVRKEKPDKDIKVRKEAEQLFIDFQNGKYKSIREFARLRYSKSHVYLTKIWKRFIPEYANVRRSVKFNSDFLSPG